ncbi:GreA/GreB family elongation factor [bacterium]|nr:GreA/GreB family elongation factor [bacterium]
MSRAFVDEDAGADETGGMHEIPLPLPPGARNYMTPEGALLMADELRRLAEEERPRAAGALAAAEPAAKAEFIRRISTIDRRVSYLTRMKAALSVVEPPASLERVVFGLVVRVSEERGEVVDYRIVGADESDPERGYVSWASPVAKALIGKRVGEIAVVRLPVGERRLRVLGIGFAE